MVPCPIRTHWRNSHFCLFLSLLFFSSQAEFYFGSFSKKNCEIFRFTDSNWGRSKGYFVRLFFQNLHKVLYRAKPSKHRINKTEQMVICDEQAEMSSCWKGNWESVLLDLWPMEQQHNPNFKLLFWCIVPFRPELLGDSSESCSSGSQTLFLFATVSICENTAIILQQ